MSSVCLIGADLANPLVNLWLQAAKNNLDNIQSVNVPYNHAKRTLPTDELEAWSDATLTRVDSFRPAYCLVFGGFATRNLLHLPTKFSDLVGKWWKLERPDYVAWCLSAFHPTAADKSKTMKMKMLEDVKYFSLVTRSGEKPILNYACVECGGSVFLRHRGIGFCKKDAPKRVDEGYQLELEI